ncbi:MAG: succinylglutamate desuccinylase/aspartoacylase family protein [Gammaproteobacteria bacterium]|nr:succinylglutamate desuccinylase/aspartoacylase family protein [Gammaproteobacteria bacterium]
MRHWLFAPLAVLGLTACALSTPTSDQPWPVPDARCASKHVLLDAHFETGNLGQCTVDDDGRFVLGLIPEDKPPINPSAWFAFRASGRPGDEVRVRLELDHGFARYWPKTSRDGRHWTPLPSEQVLTGGDRSEWMEFHFTLDGAYRWVSAQEIMDTWDYQHRIRALGDIDGVSARLLGESRQGRPIYLLETADRPEFVLFIGRQHPPEVTGAIGMRAFVDTVVGDSDLAERFRERYKLGMVPLLNPDGVAAGYWRHNEDGTDLNRDWGPFTQPETRAVLQWVESQESAGRSLALLLDFHSTWEDLFYTQPRSNDPPDFATRWLNAARDRLPDFPFRHVPSTDMKQANSKNYFYSTRGVPSITYEVGDETDREALRAAAVVFAEEMMKTLLATPAP